MSELQIRCPKCEWEPDGRPHWQCSCGHIWNTFDTQGKCPKCKMIHRSTQCIPFAGGCSGISPHHDWYADLENISLEELETMEAT